MRILYVTAAIVIFSYSELTKCNRSASTLRLEIFNARRELSDLRQNYSLVQEELKRNQVNNGSTMTLGEEVEVVANSVSRMWRDFQLLKGGIDLYDNFITNMEAAVNDHINSVQCMLYYCCGGDVKGAIRNFKGTTLKEAKKLQKKVRKMVWEIDKALFE